MKYLSFFVISLSIIWLSASQKEDNTIHLNADTTVQSVVEQLGGEASAWKPDLSMKGVSAEAGADLVLRGITKKPRGGKTKKQSKHFVCTSCHNVVKEDPDLRYASPQDRLAYCAEKGIPYLQGTTLYGAVNRTSFYNGDYDKKYGDLVKPTRNNLREAIQLCAVECSQGRKLKSWEMESVLAYLWTLELKMGDLNLSSEEMNGIQSALEGEKDKAGQLKLIESKYLKASPATFTDPPKDRTTAYQVEGDPINGKRVYDLSCKHCHADKRYSHFNLDDSKMTFKYLARHLKKYTRYSTYQVVRYGTSPMNGKKAYMPQYPLEKLSIQQMQDLRSYILQQAS